jgi:hypothetical protein
MWIGNECRDGGHRHVERAFTTMPGAIDELMRFSYQTPPLEQVSDYDKYYVMDPLQVNGAQDTATYGGMATLLETFCL